MKKLLSLSLALVLIAGLMPMGAVPAVASELPSGVTVLVEPTLNYQWVGMFSEGLAPVRTGSGNNTRYGYIDQTGALATPLMDLGGGFYGWAMPFSDGLAGVIRFNGVYNELAYIDRNGAFVIPFDKGYKPGDRNSFFGGMAVVGNSGEGAVINKSGDIIFGWDSGSNGMNSTWAYTLGDGLVKIQRTWYDGVNMDWSSDTRIYDLNGNTVFDLSDPANASRWFIDYSDGLFLFETVGVPYTFYNAAGTAVRTLNLAYEVYGFYDNILIIYDDNAERVGIYDLSANTATFFPQFEDVCGYDNGLMNAYSNRGDYLIDRTGKIIFDLNRYAEVEYEGLDGFVLVEDSNGRIALFNNKGEIIIPFGMYEEISPGNDGLFAVLGRNGRWGILHSDGTGTSGPGGAGITVSGSEPGFSVSLTTETIAMPADFTVAAFSTDGTKWKAGDLPTGNRFSKLFNKGMTLHITDEYDRKAKKPAKDATIVRFSKIDARPKRNVEKLKPLYGSDNWVLAKKGSTTAVFAGYEYAPSSDGRNPDDGVWLPVPQDGLAIIAGRDRVTYLFRAAPNSGRAASTAWRVKPANFGKAPNYSVKAVKISGSADRVDAVAFKKGDQYAIGNGPFAAALRDKTTVPVSQLGTEVRIRRAATGKRPPSETQILSLT